MDPSKEALLNGLLAKSNDPLTPETRALLVSAKSHPPVKKAFQSMEGLLPATETQEIDEYLHLALLGVATAFVERNISPHLEIHREIIPPLLDDIQAVYRALKKTDAQYDPEEFRFRAFDYGIHKAYYLDWCLYMSKEPY